LSAAPEIAPMERRAPHDTAVVLWLTAGLLLLAAASPSAAAARGFVSFHFGLPLVVGPPVYYPPPPVYYVPPPVYQIVPPPIYTSGPTSTPPQQQACHEYQSTAVIDGKPQPIVGTACLQPDGTWRIAR
jgi:hypothetical protein